VTTSRDVRQLIAGLLASVIVLVTIFGSILLSAHDSFARPIVARNVYPHADASIDFTSADRSNGCANINSDIDLNSNPDADCYAHRLPAAAGLAALHRRAV
jgi:hypothetical protein